MGTPSSRGAEQITGPFPAGFKALGAAEPEQGESGLSPSADGVGGQPGSGRGSKPSTWNRSVLL